MKNVISMVIGAGILATQFGCSTGKETEVDEAPVVQTPIADTQPLADTTKFKFDFALANIPSPASALEDLARFQVPYDNKVLNDPSKTQHYATEYKKALNLGLYNIDMAFAMVNNNGQDMLMYMKSVMELADALGLRNAVSNMVGKRAESNISNKDSLFRILDEIFIKSDAYLRSNDRVYTAALVFAGSWVESLYLNSQIAEKVTDAKQKEKAKTLLWEQRFHLGNLINVLRDFRQKNESDKLLTRLEDLHKKIVAVKDPKDLSDETFTMLTAKIREIRTGVVS
jgi:hypothetical protein